MFTIPLLKSLHALSFSLPNSNFITPRYGAGGAHPTHINSHLFCHPSFPFMAHTDPGAVGLFQFSGSFLPSSHSDLPNMLWGLFVVMLF